MACNCDTSCELEALKKSQSKTLVLVMWLNIVLFVVELTTGILAQSTALLADSLDNLGDAITYALSLYAVYRGARTKAWVALFKGGLIFLAAVFVCFEVVEKLMSPVLPSYSAMSIMSLIALVTNGYVLYLLTRHKNDDINMNSVWHCSRNDLLSNSSVLVAAFGVWMFNSGIPDILIGFGLIILFFWSAGLVLWKAVKQLRTLPPDENPPVVVAEAKQATVTLVSLESLKKKS
ncbi:Co/Zn/Cd efflux system component [Beggiatoa alba B18LD]|uniref:Co/Zn/Cd efflux system component n=1 Tax=Beggiatoa alba B18LD TaxID=395493 RepID=I3CG04_9GAMM|nr:cation transporter [Beggiatoa alba]EIJ42547.1 Co/Zn/Cd efflux system component [Beggiatoa alba B18LD]